MATSAKKSYTTNWPTGKSYGSGTGNGTPSASGSGMDKCSDADQDRMTSPYPQQPGYTDATASADEA